MYKNNYCYLKKLVNNINNSENILEDWINLRTEELETNLSKEDKKYLLNFDNFSENILDLIPEKNYILVSNILDNYRESIIQHCTYWNEKYYKTGFNDGIRLITECTGKSMNYKKY